MALVDPPLAASIHRMPTMLDAFCPEELVEHLRMALSTSVCLADYLGLSAVAALACDALESIDRG